MKKFSIVAKKDEISIQIEKKIKNELCAAGWEEHKKEPELIICVGGDGTFLHAIHKYIEIIERCSLVAIHTGTLGFFTDYTAEECDQCISDILTKKPSLCRVPLLQIQCDHQIDYAVNEMRIENVLRTQLLNVKIDDIEFETFRGTGMCVSTQSGSTAYNRSLKGAVIEEGLNLLQLNEITGLHHTKYHSLGVPYIMKPTRTIEFSSDDFRGAMMCYDQKYRGIDDVKTIKVSLSDKKFTLAKYRKINYLERLKDLY